MSVNEDHVRYDVKGNDLVRTLETACERIADNNWRELRFVVQRSDKLDVKAIRERAAMSQDQFATCFGISVRTLRNWEQGHREPEGPARAYLAVIKHEPEAVKRALEKERPKLVEVHSASARDDRAVRCVKAD